MEFEFTARDPEHLAQVLGNFAATMQALAAESSEKPLRCSNAECFWHDNPPANLTGNVHPIVGALDGMCECCGDDNVLVADEREQRLSHECEYQRSLEPHRYYNRKTGEHDIEGLALVERCATCGHWYEV